MWNVGGEIEKDSPPALHGFFLDFVDTPPPGDTHSSGRINEKADLGFQPHATAIFCSKKG